MTLEKIQTAIVEVLKEVQQLSGRDYRELPLSARPVLDLDGFDSLCSFEATVMVEEKLGCIGLLKIPSIFISEENGQKRALTLLETAKVVEGLINSKGGSQ